jgi:hypothetical protein
MVANASGRAWVVIDCASGSELRAELRDVFLRKDRFICDGEVLLGVIAPGGGAENPYTAAVARAIQSGAARGVPPRGLFACSILCIACRCGACIMKFDLPDFSGYLRSQYDSVVSYDRSFPPGTVALLVERALASSEGRNQEGDSNET